MGNLAGHEEWDKSLDEDGHLLLMALGILGTTLLHNYFMSLNMVLKNQILIMKVKCLVMMRYQMKMFGLFLNLSKVHGQKKY